MVVVEHPQRVKPRDPGHPSLLPVQPPKIHSLFFIGVVEILEIGVHKCPVGKVKGNGLFLFPVPAQGFGHLLIRLLKPSHPVCRVYIQAHLQPMVMEPPHKTFRIRKKLPVPGIACPPVPILGVNIHQMPVHIDHRHRQGDPFLFKAPHQVFIFLLCIFMVPAPPVAKHKPGKQGRMPAEMVEIPQALFVSMPIAKKVKVHRFLAPLPYPAFFQEGNGAAVIQNCDTVPGQQPRL